MVTSVNISNDNTNQDNQSTATPMAPADDSKVIIRGYNNTVDRAYVSSAAEGDKETGMLLATARDQQGHVTSEVNGDTILTLPGGMSLRAEQAAQQGLIKRDKDGGYTELDGSIPKSNAEVYEEMTVKREADEQEQAERERTEVIPPTQDLDDKADAGIAELQERIGNNAVASIANRIIAEDGEFSGVNDLAAQLGAHPEKVKAGLEDIKQAHQKVADNFIKHNAPDVNPNMLWAWARDNMSQGEIHDAMRNHVFRNDMSGYKNMLSKYRQQAAGKASTQQGGIGGDDGLVRIGGMEMQREQAVALGLI